MMTGRVVGGVAQASESFSFKEERKELRGQVVCQVSKALEVGTRVGRENRTRRTLVRLRAGFAEVKIHPDWGNRVHRNGVGTRFLT